MKPGVVVALNGRQRALRQRIGLRLIERAVSDEDTGGWIVQVEGEHTANALDRIGRDPPAPYIPPPRDESGTSEVATNATGRYQTPFASDRSLPTVRCRADAGLHSRPICSTASSVPASIGADVELAVGLGNLQARRAEFVEQHPLPLRGAEFRPRPPRHPCQRPGRQRRAAPRAHHRRGTNRRPQPSILRITDEMLAARSQGTRLLITPATGFRHVDAAADEFPPATLDADGPRLGVPRSTTDAQPVSDGF